MKHWIQTYTGLRVDPTDLHPEDIQILDIAHSLALTNRFTGHSPIPYSVAQHSVLVSTLCPDEHQLWGLLHDAAEAYLADISRPVKMAIKDKGCDMLVEIEAAIMKAICAKFELPEEEPAIVKVNDDIALANEAYSLFGNTKNYALWQHRFCNGYRDLGFIIEPRDWKGAEKDFLEQYYWITKPDERSKAVEV